VHAYFFEQINDYDGDNKLYDNDMYFSLQMTSSPNINFVNNSQKILLLIKIPPIPAASMHGLLRPTCNHNNKLLASASADIKRSRFW